MTPISLPLNMRHKPIEMKSHYQSFGSDEEIIMPKKQSKKQKDDERNEWQGSFEWDCEVELANKEVFGNENFREN